MVGRPHRPALGYHMMHNVFVVDGPTRGLRYELQNVPMTLGRSSSADIIISHDKKVSHFHAKLLTCGTQSYLIQDLGSTNGTYVNGEAVEQCPLRNGDRFRIGRTHFLFTDQETIEAAEATHSQPQSSMGGSSDGKATTPSVGGGPAMHGLELAVPSSREDTGHTSGSKTPPSVGGGPAMHGLDSEDLPGSQADQEPKPALVGFSPPEPPTQPPGEPTNRPDERDQSDTGFDHYQAPPAQRFMDWTEQEGTERPLASKLGAKGELLFNLPAAGESAAPLLALPARHDPGPGDPEDTHSSIAAEVDTHALRTASLRLDLLYRLGNLIATRRDEHTFLSDVLDISLRAMHAERGSIFLLEDTGDEAATRPVKCVVWRAPKTEISASADEAQTPFAVSSTIVNHAIIEGHAVLTSDATRDDRYKAQTSVILSGVRSAMCVPLRVRQILGAIYVDNRFVDASFSEDDLRFLGAIANQTAVGIEELRLFSELYRTNQELRALDGMKANFMALVAHELRTPLTNIQSPLDLLEQDSLSLQERQEMLGIVRRGSNRMQRLVRDVSEFLGIVSGDRTLKRENVQISEICGEVVAYYTPGATAKGVAIQLEITDTPVVFADKRLMTQVLSRLIENAVKFTDSGSIRIGAAATGQEVTVSIRDTGKGIHPEHLRRVFSELQAAHDIQEHSQGIGIGLAVCKAIIERHDGNIWVESAGEGQGTTFTFMLPVRSEPETS